MNNSTKDSRTLNPEPWAAEIGFLYKATLYFTELIEVDWADECEKPIRRLFYKSKRLLGGDTKGLKRVPKFFSEYSQQPKNAGDKIQIRRPPILSGDPGDWQGR